MRVVPGIGMMSSPWASSHARVIWPAVTLYFFAIAWMLSTTRRTLGKFSAEKRGVANRQSPSFKSAGDRCRCQKDR